MPWSSPEESRNPAPLLERIEHYLDRTGLPPTAFGRTVLHDPRFVHDLHLGRQPRPETAARVHAWLDTQEGIAR
jgi:hypothetical protein